ncbi:MAG: transcriptional regulator, family protein [Labilithrix sp.]|nr:transcriptional regulator, family protein [Labilithrix sp.]
MSDALFPARLATLRGRTRELATLARMLRETAPTRVALVGAGGSGKSVLAAALGHRVRRAFPGGVHWFRVGAWDFRTLVEMLALRFGTSRKRAHAVPELRALLEERGETLIVLDNHEDDAAMSRFLEAFARTPATFVITARRCLLAGVLVFPVTAPLVTSLGRAFPRVAPLTRMLRWNPLALDLADALVRTRAVSATALRTFLVRRGIERVRVLEHEDDLPEVALLLAWAWPRLTTASRRMLAVLGSIEGDSVDETSLATLARVTPREAPAALTALERWHLVQEPMHRRFTLHAVVRHAVRKRATFDLGKAFQHYVTMLEQHPDRLLLEQTHLFAAMDHAHRTSDLAGMLRLERLLARLDE